MEQTEPGPTRGSRRLTRWLKKNRIPDSTLAEVVGIDGGYVGRLKRGERTPGLRVAFAIQDFTTNGDTRGVRARSWLREVE